MNGNFTQLSLGTFLPQITQMSQIWGCAPAIAISQILFGISQI